MKQCPSCGRTYNDDTLSFCLDDGATLSEAYDPQATWIGPPPADSSRAANRADSREKPQKRTRSKQSKSKKRRPQATKARESGLGAQSGEAPATPRTVRERAVKGNEPGQTSRAEISRRVWIIASASILLVSAFLRIYQYDLKPFHHDEGVNGFFLIDLFRNYKYQYDPANYHGPTLYYFALLSSLLFGLNDFAVRLVPAVFGVATVWLMLSLRRYIGTIGALTAAALVAVSPCAVFYSRYFIHESLFVFFSVGIVVAALRYHETAKPIYLMLLTASAALLFGTKETALITAAVFVIGVVSAEIYQRMRGTRRVLHKSRKRKKQERFAQKPEPPKGVRATLARFGETRDLIWLGLTAIALFIIIHILFYSSFFTYARGVSDSLATFKIWVRTGTSDFHAKPWRTYLEWLEQEEAALLLLGIGGIITALWRATNRFAVFAALWTVGIIAAYSLVPYKTPWLVLNFIPPLAIMGGYAVNTLYQSEYSSVDKALALSMALVAVVVGAYQTVTLNFYHYDDEQYPYVYAHTNRGYLELIKEINSAAQRAGTKGQTTISIASPDYWPMPWYLRDYKSVGYPGRVGNSTEQIVVCNSNQESECQARLGPRYRRVGTYPLRDGIMLVLYERNDVP